MRSLLAFQFMAGMLDIMYCDNTLMKKYLTKATPRLAEPAKYCNTVDLRCVSLCPKLATFRHYLCKDHGAYMCSGVLCARFHIWCR